jgi:ribose/xylose/arabinose/galactoside ABC-type transport system permease subunit
VSAVAPPVVGPGAGTLQRALVWFRRSLARYTIQYLLLVAVVVIGLTNENSRQLANIQSVLLQSSFVGIGAAGMTVVIVNGAFDLSVATMLALCGVVLALLLPSMGIAPVIVVSLALGALLGVINGVVVTKLRIPAFIATLGMMNVYLALAFIINGGQVVPVTDKAFRSLGTGELLGVPIPFLVMIVTYLVLHVILSRTTYGRFIRASGSNETAAQVGGIRVDRVRIVAFAILGLCVGLAAVVLTAYLSSANAIMAQGYELRVIAAAVVGGTSLRGGSYTLLGTFTGALFFTLISNAMNMYNVGAYWQYVAVGLIIIIALGLDALRRRYSGGMQE